jgi:hypothetical protein
MFKVKSTRRQKRSVSPAERPGTNTIEHVPPPQNSFDSFFDAETTTALNKPWLRLERGPRLQRFRVFADEYPELTEEGKEQLYKFLVKANDAKLLNTKQQVVYEEGKIQSIRGLRKVTDDPVTFKIEHVRATKKKTREDSR